MAGAAWGKATSPSNPAARCPPCVLRRGRANPPPFLTLPTSCTGPLQTASKRTRGRNRSDLLTAGPDRRAMPALDGCDRLPFSASLEVAPDVQSASTPSGLTVKVHVPQEVSLDGEALAAADVKDTTVTLPEGVTVNPANADGLEACTGDPGDQPGTPGNEIGFEGFTELNKGSEPGVRTATFTERLPGTFGSSEKLEPGVNFCPDASKIANATITVPVLAHPLKGAVYLASPQNFSVLTGAPPENPFESLIAMYLVAEDPVSGVLVKLPGKGQPRARRGSSPRRLKTRRRRRLKTSNWNSSAANARRWRRLALPPSGRSGVSDARVVRAVVRRRSRPGEHRIRHHLRSGRRPLPEPRGQPVAGHAAVQPVARVG